MSLTYTQEQLDALVEAYTSGELTVEWNGHRVTYRSQAELERVISRVRKALDLANGKKPIRTMRVLTSKGF